MVCNLLEVGSWQQTADELGLSHVGLLPSVLDIAPAVDFFYVVCNLLKVGHLLCSGTSVCTRAVHSDATCGHECKACQTAASWATTQARVCPDIDTLCTELTKIGNCRTLGGL